MTYRQRQLHVLTVPDATVALEELVQGCKEAGAVHDAAQWGWCIASSAAATPGELQILAGEEPSTEQIPADT